MDRRLLDYDPEEETFETASAAPAANDAVFGEADEMELAASLLEVASEAGLDRFLGDLVGRAGRAVGRVAPASVGGALSTMLNTAARQTLPVVAGAVGRRLGGGSGAGVAAQVVDAAARYFGLELEGLSPEDQEFEAARRFIRFAGEAARNAVAAPAPRMPSMLASPRGGSDGEFAPTLIRACLMGLLDLRGLAALAGAHTIA
jgi:hypothetical protein